MKKSGFAIAVVLVLCGVVCLAFPCTRCARTGITQIATIDALLAGNYDGVIPAGELKRYGNLGIGTVDGLDGEMVLLDGRVFHVRSDGKAYSVPDKATIPFASVVNFRAEKSTEMPVFSNMEDFLKTADKIRPEKNIPVVMRMFGKFPMMKTRSVPRQNKPYPPLVEVTKTQPEFNLKNVEGWLIGFRLPSYVKGINVPGWHLHFLSADEKSGGHVLDFRMESGKMETAAVYDFRMILPKDSEAFRNTDFSVDRSRELRKAESDH